MTNAHRQICPVGFPLAFDTTCMDEIVARVWAYGIYVHVEKIELVVRGDKDCFHGRNSLAAA